MSTPIPTTTSFLNSTSIIATPCQGQGPPKINPKHEVWFGVVVAICSLIVTIGTILNSLVIYFAKRKPLTGTLRHLNMAVRQLAVSDLLFGILAFPLNLYRIQLGTFCP